MGHLELYHISVFLGVLACWLVFAAMFLFRTRPPRASRTRLDRNFLPGLILQGAGFALVWGMGRQLFVHLADMPLPLETALAIFTVLLAAASAAFAISAVKILGKQWSAASRTIEGHELITTGPYGVVRHPVYTGMFGLLIATGLSISRWEGLAGGIALYVLGTWIRIASEERLLREEFGGAYEEYSKRVPAFLPFLR